MSMIASIALYLLLFCNHVFGHESCQSTPNGLRVLLPTCLGSQEQSLKSTEERGSEREFNSGQQVLSQASSGSQVEAKWTRKPRCVTAKDSNQKYCIFTNSAFSHSRGISIFATPLQGENFLHLPAFSQNKSHDGDTGKEHKKPYIVEKISGHGMGVVADSPLLRGDTVMNNLPVVILQDDIYFRFTEQQQARILNVAVNQLPRQSKDDFMSLAGEFGGDPVVDIINTNSFQVSLFDTAYGFGTPYVVLVPEIARFNHDCRPNAYYHFNSLTLQHSVLAARPIEPGEEITISYIPQLQMQHERVAQLNDSWGFSCDCRLCKAEAVTLAASDNRVAQINELKSQLRDYRPEAPVTPAMGELLISLYEQEGIWGPINEAYTMAAIEWNAVGDIAKMKHYAGMALEAGLLYRGTGHHEVVAIEKLLKDPTRHWSWKMRVNHE